MVRPGSCVRPAGVSPVPVGVGAPGSRPRFVGEIWRAERGVKSLFGGSKSAGRSVMRTFAASSDSQWESRAAHVTVKAMSVTLDSEWCGGSLRGKDGGTYSRSGTEQERPVCARLVGQETGRISRW